jgi:uncharacterized protein with GYD domain
MSMCVSLSNWTDKGIASFKESPERAALAAELARKHGGRMVHLYWTIGAYDLVGVFDMPDEASFTARALESGALGGSVPTPCGRSTRTSSSRSWPKRADGLQGSEHSRQAQAKLNSGGRVSSFAAGHH